MSEYKENTVGWHLNRLNEPLRSRALESARKIEFGPGLEDGLLYCEYGLDQSIRRLVDFNSKSVFWQGVWCFFNGEKPYFDDEYCEGYNMARECAPDPEHGGRYTQSQLDEAQAFADSEARNDEAFARLFPAPVEEEPRPTFLDCGCEACAETSEAWEKINNETIEGRHDREIKELQYRLEMVLRMVGNVSEKYEARVTQLEDQLFKYFGSKNG